MKAAALTGLLIALLCPEICFSQSDDDPFGGGSGAERSPFDEEPRRPEIPQTPGTDDLRRLHQHIEELKAQLMRTEMQSKVRAEENATTRAALEKELAHRQLVQAGYQELLQLLIAHREPQMQMMGIAELQRFTEQYRDEIHRDWSVDDAVMERLIHLLDSPAVETSTAASRALVTIDPVVAGRLGFQSGKHPWLSENRPAEHIILNRRATMDYYETRLDDVLEEIRQNFRVMVTTAPEVDTEQLVTLTLEGMPLREGLGRIVEQLGLTFRLIENELHILPIDHDEARLPLTYNVRGLLTGQLTIEDIVRISREAVVNDRSEEETGFAIRPVDEHRVLVSGSEQQHTKAAMLFSILLRFDPRHDD
ncbi:MAG: hypothetical protein ACR2NP_08140 [Pirellulaceae bacterium]